MGLDNCKYYFLLSSEYLLVDFHRNKHRKNHRYYNIYIDCNWCKLYSKKSLYIYQFLLYNKMRYHYLFEKMHYLLKKQKSILSRLSLSFAQMIFPLLYFYLVTNWL